MPASPHEFAPEPPSSMTMVRIGGAEYPLRSVGNCRTCQSPHRKFIENELLLGRSYAAIERSVADMPPGRLPHPSQEAISNHVKQGHMPAPAHTRRRIIDRRAEQLGAAIAGEDDLVDYLVVNDMVIRRGYERLMSGEIEPGTNELLQAIALKHKIESTSQEGYDAEAYQEAMFAYLEVARKYIPAEMFQQYGRELSRHPILRAIAAKQVQAQVVEGEVGTDE